MRYESRITEDNEQEFVFEWAQMQSGKYPELKLMYHVPNEGKRSASYGARLKRSGMKTGVSDICLPVSRGGYHGLYIELKVNKNKPTKEQREFTELMLEQEYLACVCYGADEATSMIKKYLSLPKITLRQLLVAMQEQCGISIEKAYMQGDI